MNLQIRLLASIAASCLSVASAFGASDLKAGAAKSETCVPCHGRAGISTTPETPSLAGQPDNFLQWQLVYFRSGVRKSPVMQPMAASLTDDDIRNVAAWFAAQVPPTSAGKGAADPALQAAGAKIARENRCAACHKDDFTGQPQQATPRLAAQREDYLLKALRDFKAGTRVGGGVAAMADVVQPLGEADFRALAHFMANFP
ncbi:MAG: c-type cytochrome [Caldimonas sp.]